jgi:hypothetical protein
MLRHILKLNDEDIVHWEYERKNIDGFNSPFDVDQ